MPQTAKKEPLEIFAERRFHLPDLNEKGIWLVNELKERFKSTDGELVNWLRAVIVGSPNEFLFVRTDHAVALAQVYREPLSSRCVVQEQFVLVDDDQFMDQGAYLYSVVYQWAKMLNAYELRIENLTNVPRQMIKARIGELFERPLTLAKL
jgi:hypothetical protein